ncbi:S-adenosyl-L-methionine-dependent methyltransferase [Xylaria curta]|nr:S-adenosyl-L-methionine-dependent methyltransferase [Xylaria curta]
MEQAIDQIKAIAAKADRQGQQHLMSVLHQLAYSMEDPDDTLNRCSRMPLESATIMIGHDLGLFKYLTSQDGVSIQDIADKTGAEVGLLNRVVRYLAAIGAVDESSLGQITANKVTQNLSTDAVAAGMYHAFHTIGPQYQALPSFLKRTGYKDPTNELQTPFQDAWNTPLDAFSWFSEQPDHLAYFNDFMALRRQPETSWLSVYPVREKIKGSNPDRPVYVNIGGGIGHQCVQFKNAFPDIPGRVILQDLPHTISQALSHPEVENMACDFYQPQPITGATFYFMRGVLHDHPPHLVSEILKNTKAAMAPDSILLVDEMILPETGVSAPSAAVDMTMLAARGGMERTERQWCQTFQDAGLELVKTYTYNPASYESVMEVCLAQDDAVSA